MRRNLKADILDACQGWERKYVIQVFNEISKETSIPPSVSFFEICEKQFGVDYQYACNSEEVFELIESLTRYGKLTSRDRRPDRRQDDQSIVSEMADVIICIFQLLHTRRVSPEVLNNVMREKIKRTCLHESVRTAILELSKRITKETHISAPTVADSPQKP